MIPPKCVLGYRNISEQTMPAFLRVAKERLNGSPPEASGRGIIIAGGGPYTRWAFASAQHARTIGWQGPIQVWHIGRHEIAPGERQKFEGIGVELIDAKVMLGRHPMRRFSGWHLKMYAVAWSNLAQVMFLDADCFVTPEGLRLFEHPDFLAHRALFFRDIKRCRRLNRGYQLCGLAPPELINAQEWETGVFVVDKVRHWKSVQMVNWMHEHSNIFFKLAYGDKAVTEWGWRYIGDNYLLSQACHWRGWGIEHLWDEKPVAMHAMAAKRGEHPLPPDLQLAWNAWG